MGNTNGYFSKSIRGTDMLFTWSKALISVYDLLELQWPWPHFQGRTGHYWNSIINHYKWHKSVVTLWCIPLHYIMTLLRIGGWLHYDTTFITVKVRLFSSPTDGRTLHYISGMNLWLTALHQWLDHLELQGSWVVFVCPCSWTFYINRDCQKVSKAYRPMGACLDIKLLRLWAL